MGSDTLCVAVYEFDNGCLPQGLSGPDAHQTKGQVVTTANISQFMMSAWMESENRYDPDIHPEQLSDGHVYDVNDKDDYRVIPGVTVSREGSGWAMDAPTTGETVFTPTSGLSTLVDCHPHLWN